MKRILISEFKKHPSLVDGMHRVTILIPYGEEDIYLRHDMFMLGFNIRSTRFVGPDLMDVEKDFVKF